MVSRLCRLHSRQRFKKLTLLARNSGTPVSQARESTKGFKVRGTKFEDYEQIAALGERYGIRRRSSDEWRSFWAGNPAYRDLKSEWSIGWVIEDADRQIVASVENIPFWYYFGGRKILAASGRAQVAAPPYRSAVQWLLNKVINQPGVSLYLNATMSETALPSFSAFNCPRVPAGRWDESAFWILGYRGLSKSFLAGRNYPAPALLSFPVSMAVRARDLLAPSPVRESDVEVQDCGGFDDRFEMFWEELKGKNPHVLLGARSRETLEWHFKHASLARRLWIAAVADGPRLAAYGIFLRKDNPELGLKRIRFVDFQAADGSNALLAAVIAWALERCRAEGIHILESIGRWLDNPEFMKAFHPHRRKLSVWSFYYQANEPKLAKSLEAREAWRAASSFDGDASL